ncbi:MAG: TetR/AcrR family transcriptional regulator [Steroidobacter sp.]
MGTRDTQTRIVDAALELFNQHGTAAISTNRIAEHCGISKGNLHYHFRNKQEIIRFLFERAVDEMDAGWYRDHLAATLEHMAAMFVRQLQLIRDYRFFYREMADLLRRDRLLRRRFAHNRERRLAEIEKFFGALANRGLMNLPADPRRLRSIVDITWIVSENWLNYVEYHDRELTVAAVAAGYDQILEVLRPYLIADPQRVTNESYSIIERLTAQPLTPG